MKKIVVALLLMCIFTGVRADDGMWLLSRLKGETIKKMMSEGCKLSASDIYDVNHSSLKDAVIGLGYGAKPTSHFCTAELVSGEGLLLTNHHCGYSSIQSHSSLEHNYLKEGFWAKNNDEELSAPGVSASILQYMEDVTDRVFDYLTEGVDDAEREMEIKDVCYEICNEVYHEHPNEGFYAEVTPLFAENQYFLFVYKVYLDVRLVAAPPEGIGKFGGDTDNWMWPRHTGDFSILRIYTAPDGSPAEYNLDNVPLKPNYYLPISIKGIEENDFAMVLGYPGSTQRFATSYELQRIIEHENEIRYGVRTIKLNILWDAMEQDEATRIKYASKASQCSNYWKNAYEQNKALANLHTMDKKIELEEEFTKWVAANPERKAHYGDALSLIEEGYNRSDTLDIISNYLYEAFYSGAEAPRFACRYNRVLDAYIRGPEEYRVNNLEILLEGAEEFYKDYDEEVDKRLFYSLYEYAFTSSVEVRDFLAELLVESMKGDEDYSDFVEPSLCLALDGDLVALTDSIYSNSIFSTKEKFEKFLENPDRTVLGNDPLFWYGNEMMVALLSVRSELQNIQDKYLPKGNMLFVEGIMEMNPDKEYYPDANSTLRLSYGNVMGYSPKDAVSYSYRTTMKGVIEKADPNSLEFNLPERAIELYNAGDFGEYADETGVLPVCFITNNDITGGNSGSPVLNGKGELIGIAFDGNSEAMSGDIYFEENLQRCISVDIRYVLWVIDKFAGAKNIIKELNIVKR